MLNAIQWFVGLGASVVLPILIFIFGLILGTKPGKAFVAALTVGVGFIGLNLVIGLLTSSLGAAAQQMVSRFHLHLNVIDIGWPAASAISYGTALGSMSIPIAIIVNVILLVFGLTRTLNIDIWNMWHAAFIASLTYALTQSWTMGVAAIVVYTMMVLFMGDVIGPKIGKFYGFPDITFPHGDSAPGYFIALPFQWLFNRIPGFKDLKADPETIQKRFGIFGDSTVMGFIIGLIIGVLAGQNFTQVAQLSVQTAAVMILMPRMVSLLMEGLMPISEAAKVFIEKRFPGRKLYLGMDSALSIGHPAVLSASLLMVPITILLAVVLPGNSTIPFGDLATIPYLVCLMAVVFEGNVIRTVVAGSIYMISVLYIASWVSPLVTSAAKAAKFNLEGHAHITALVEGGIWPTLVYMGGIKLIGWGIFVIVFLLLLGGMIYTHKILPKRESKTESK
ncbi:PTS galactitol transporter subunit IIC [Lactovum odontotermitis]